MLVQELLGVKHSGVSFEVLVHVGTLLAVLIYFRRRIVELTRSLFSPEMHSERLMVGLLIVGTIPTYLAGLFLVSFFEEAFLNPVMTSVMLLVTGVILLSTRFVRKGNRSLNWLAALVMGIGQALAIMPGISRSGSTIAIGMLVGLNPSKAAEFSFLLAVPAIAGAVVLKSGDLMAIEHASTGPYVVGSVFAFVLGLVAVYAVLEIIRRGRFDYFAYYCFAVGALGLYLFI